MTSRRLWGVALIPAALLGLVFAGPAQQAGESVVIREPVSEDLYLAGGTVDVGAEVVGDVIAAGGQVTIEDRVDGDVMAAGGQVTIRGPVTDDVRAAGGQIELSGPIGDDAIAAAGAITLAAGASAEGRAWFSGGEIRVDGRVGRELKARGGRIVVSGTVRGDAELSGDVIEIVSGAVIDGDLTYRSPREARVSPGAEIRGAVDYVQTERASPIAGFLRRLLVYASLLIVGVVLFVLFPSFALSTAERARSEPWASLGVGLAVLVGVPIAIAISVITIAGAALGILTLLLYIIVLPVGFLTGAFLLGDLGLRAAGRVPGSTLGWRLGSLALALVALAVLREIPILGFLLVLAVLLVGLGALHLQLHRSYSRVRTEAA